MNPEHKNPDMLQIEFILGKAICDDAFRQRLFDDPTSLKKEFGLSEETLRTARQIDKAWFIEVREQVYKKIATVSAGPKFCGA